MNESLIGKWVTYYGSTDKWYGNTYQIIDEGKEAVRFGGKRIAFMPEGTSKPVWRTLGNSFSIPFTKNEVTVPVKTAVAGDDENFDKALGDFLTPYAGAINDLDVEIERLKTRIAELEAAKKVLASL